VRRIARATLAILLALATAAGPVSAQQPVVRAVLFWSATCPHCAEVKDKILPPLQARYGNRLDIKMVEVSTQASVELFVATLQAHKVPQDDWGVPFLLIGSTYLVGSDQIAERLVTEIELGLAAGGLDYPTLAGSTTPTVAPAPSPTRREKECMTCEEEIRRFALRTPEPVVATPTPGEIPTPSPAATPVPLPTATPTAVPILALEMKGETGPALLAAAVDLGMIVALLIVAWLLAGRLVRLYAASRGSVAPSALLTTTPAPPGLAILALAVVGLIAALYLTQVELSHSHAMCGPLSDCDLVQASPYAKIMGVPVAFLGVLGYVGILAAWAVGQWVTGRWAFLIAWIILALAFVGTAFSAYLTFLEPFVIGAVCPWCLTSAVAMTLILVAAARSTLATTTRTPGPSERDTL